MQRGHVGVLVLASLLLGGGVVAWLCVLPDGTRHTYPRETHVFVSLGAALVGGLGLYAAVVVPTTLHALRGRWPFRLAVVASVPFALLNVGPVLKGLAGATESVSQTQNSNGHGIFGVFRPGK